MRVLNIVGTLIFCLCVVRLASQTRAIDSLTLFIKESANDTGRIKTLNELADALIIIGEFDKAHEHVREAKNLSVKLKYRLGEAIAENNFGRICSEKGAMYDALLHFKNSLDIFNRAEQQRSSSGIKGVSAVYLNLGNLYYNKGELDTALQFYIHSYRFRKEYRKFYPEDEKNNRSIATCIKNMGLVYDDKGDFPKALEYYIAALKIAEMTGNKKVVGGCLNNVSLIYRKQGEFAKAKEYLLQSLKIKEEMKDKKGVGSSYLNLGLLLENQGEKIDKKFVARRDSFFRAACEYYLLSLNIKEEIGEKKGISQALNNIGIMYKELRQPDKALEFYTRALKIREETGDKQGLVLSYINLGNLESYSKKWNTSRIYFEKALQLAKQLNQKEWLRSSYEGLANIDTAIKDFRSGVEHYKLYIAYRDSLINEENTKKIVQEQMRYEFGKKEAAGKAMQDRKDVLAAQQLKQQKQQRNYFIGGFALVLLLAIFILRSFLEKRQANRKLEEKNILIERQKHLVEEKQKEILDSILYARRIQRALITSEKNFKRQLSRVRINKK